MLQVFRAVAGVLAVAVLLTGGGLRADDEPAKKDEPRKERPKGDDVRKEEPRRDDARGDQDVQKQLEQLRREMADMRRQVDQVRRFFPGMPPNMPAVPDARRFSGEVPSPFGGGGPFAGHPRLGVRVDPPSETLTEQLDLKKGQGLVIGEVVEDSPAAKAGLKPHDVLVELNGKAVPSSREEFARMVSGLKSDAAVDAKVIRKGKEETVKGIKLREAPADALPAPRPRGEPGRRESR